MHRTFQGVSILAVLTALGTLFTALGSQNWASAVQASVVLAGLLLPSASGAFITLLQTILSRLQPVPTPTPAPDPAPQPAKPK